MQEQEKFKLLLSCLIRRGMVDATNAGSFWATDVYPGEKSQNGGEYGFYSHYTATDIPGVYQLQTSTTCDFDACGTGDEGYVFVSDEERKDILAHSEEVEARGSQY